MTDLASILAALHRPKILIRAARAGVSDYRRERDLRRLVRDGKGSAPQDAMAPLLAEENRLETNRTLGDATYSIQRHVAVLTAILAEARVAASTQTPCASPSRSLAARPAPAPECKSLMTTAAWSCAA